MEEMFRASRQRALSHLNATLGEFMTTNEDHSLANLVKLHLEPGMFLSDFSLLGPPGPPKRLMSPASGSQARSQAPDPKRRRIGEVDEDSEQSNEDRSDAGIASPGEDVEAAAVDQADQAPATAVSPMQLNIGGRMRDVLEFFNSEDFHEHLVSL